ncbi:hypothetical protein [Methylococcus capsulatus]|jgi:hypothetical protein|uniref:Uncharacterized protein n=1 Tax=Methylococcus capsulatus TaxID=414 RepID=A0AA35V008_METCP|nr:hypothetical protein [Methylococcus capsulatus]CAI8811811.1 protein of unknown function [Methylococcus capsulatus]
MWPPVAEEGGVVREVRLRRLSFEPKEGSASVSLGEGSRHITRSIADVAAVGVREAERDVHAGRRIDSAGHGARIPRLRAPASPGRLDGLFAPWL